jgi:hypothetical protein
MTKLADSFKDYGGAGGGGGFILHQHSDLSLTETGGGPSVSVFGVK